MKEADKALLWRAPAFIAHVRAAPKLLETIFLMKSFRYSCAHCHQTPHVFYNFLSFHTSLKCNIHFKYGLCLRWYPFPFLYEVYVIYVPILRLVLIWCVFWIHIKVPQVIVCKASAIFVKDLEGFDKREERLGQSESSISDFQTVIHRYGKQTIWHIWKLSQLPGAIWKLHLCCCWKV